MFVFNTGDRLRVAVSDDDLLEQATVLNALNDVAMDEELLRISDAYSAVKSTKGQFQFGISLHFLAHPNVPMSHLHLHASRT